jgi:hypothetical protein
MVAAPLLVVVDSVDANRDGDHQHVVLAGSRVRPYVSRIRNQPRET